MKSIPTLVFAAIGLLVTGQASAQSADYLARGSGASLLGHKYSGVEFGYTHHVESAPDALHRYGLVSHAPIPEMENLDGAFRYDYTRGSSDGLTSQRHRATAGLVRYFVHRTAKPFIDVEIGWAWRKLGVIKEDSFFYRGTLGAELGVSPNVALTPFFSYHEASNLSERAWSYGARLAYRMDRNWIPTLSIQVDEKHNIEYTIAARYRY